jgi:hypothetical protein
MATRLCGKVFGFVKRNYPERSGVRVPLAERSAGKRRQPLSPPRTEAARARSADDRSVYGRIYGRVMTA